MPISLRADFGLEIGTEDEAHMRKQPFAQAAKGDAKEAVGKYAGFVMGRGGGHRWANQGSEGDEFSL